MNFDSIPRLRYSTGVTLPRHPPEYFYTTKYTKDKKIGQKIILYYFFVNFVPFVVTMYKAWAEDFLR